jgi:hypothetical protein
MKPKFAKCRPVGIDTALIRRLSRRRSQASRYCPEFGLSRARNEAPKRACRRRLTVLEAVPEPRPTPSRRAAPPTALCWALPSTAWNLCWLCCLYGSFELLSLVIAASMSTTARLEELKRDLAQLANGQNRTSRSGDEMAASGCRMAPADRHRDARTSSALPLCAESRRGAVAMGFSGRHWGDNSVGRRLDRLHRLRRQFQQLRQDVRIAGWRDHPADLALPRRWRSCSAR